MRYMGDDRYVISLLRNGVGIWLKLSIYNILCNLYLFTCDGKIKISRQRCLHFNAFNKNYTGTKLSLPTPKENNTRIYIHQMLNK